MNANQHWRREGVSMQMQYQPPQH